MFKQHNNHLLMHVSSKRNLLRGEWDYITTKVSVCDAVKRRRTSTTNCSANPIMSTVPEQQTQQTPHDGELEMQPGADPVPGIKYACHVPLQLPVADCDACVMVDQQSCHIQQGCPDPWLAKEAHGLLIRYLLVSVLEYMAGTLGTALEMKAQVPVRLSHVP